MTRIKTGSAIKTKADLSSLVTGILFRQQEPFSEEEIREMILAFCTGSGFDREEIEQLISEHIDTFERNDYLHFKNGKYVPNNI